MRKRRKREHRGQSGFTRRTDVGSADKTQKTKEWTELIDLMCEKGRSASRTMTKANQAEPGRALFVLLPFAMIPYVIPVGVFLVLAVLRRIPAVADRYTMADCAAWSLAAMLLLTGGAHFVGLREEMIRMVPPVFPRPDVLVTVTGVLELAGAIGLVVKRTRVAAGICLAILFVAMLPANIYAGQQGLMLAGKPATPLVRRIPEQIIYIAFALGPVFAATRKRNTLRGLD